jgi:4-amino-4-deoxy-L-arabinose transferase-like glycosyltransferase
LSQTDKSLYDHLPRWWISHNRYGDPFLSKFRIVLVAIIFYWTCTAHPLLAIIPGALLVDLAIRAEGQWILRFFVAWFLLNIAYFAITGAS